MMRLLKALTLRRTRVLIGTLAVASLVVAGAALSASSGYDDNPQPAASPAPGQDPVLKGRFAILRQPASPQDAPPPSMRNGDLIQDYGENLAATRFAQTTDSGDGLFLTPATEGLCLGTRRVGTVSCQSTEAAESGALIVSVICALPLVPANAIMVYGAVPDGTDRVVVLRADGSEQQLKVRNNSWSLETKKSESLPTSVSLDGPDGIVTRSSTVPSDAADSQCVAPGSSR